VSNFEELAGLNEEAEAEQEAAEAMQCREAVAQYLVDYAETVSQQPRISYRRGESIFISHFSSIMARALPEVAKRLTREFWEDYKGDE